MCTNNGNLTKRFDCKTGVKQNDDIFPTLYSIFINDMVQETNNLHVGIELVNRKLSITLYENKIYNVC